MSNIKRSKRNTPFVLLNKESLQDKSISWQAKGLLAYLLSLPDDWQILVVDLANRSTNGKDSTAAILNELIKAGYIERQKIKDEKNRFGGYDYTVFDSPKKESPKTDNPFTGNPKTESPKTGNSELLSTNLNNKPFTNKPKREKKGTPPQNSEFEDLQKQLEYAKEQLAILEAEKLKKEKSSEKKESGKHEFPKQNSKPKSELKITPKHANDILQEAWNASDKTETKKPFEVAIQDYDFNELGESMKEAILEFCQDKFDKSDGKFSGTQAKALIREIKTDSQKYGIQKIEDFVRRCTRNGWKYDIKYQINQETRDKEDEIKRQKQQANDPTISLIESSARARFGNDFREVERQDGYGKGYIDQSEQEF